MCCSDNVFVSVHAMWEGVLFTPSPSIACRQAKNNYLNNERKMLSESLLVVCLDCATSFPVLMISTVNKFTVQSGWQIANNPNFDSTSIHCPAATAKMKTNLLDNISIQFEGEPKGVPLVLIKLLLRIMPSLLCWIWIDLFPCPVLPTCSLYSRR